MRPSPSSIRKGARGGGFDVFVVTVALLGSTSVALPGGFVGGLLDVEELASAHYSVVIEAQPVQVANPKDATRDGSDPS